MLGEGGTVPVSCPTEAAEAAAAAVELGAPVTVIIQCYRAGHAVLWAGAQEEVEKLGLEPGQQRELLDAVSEFLFAYADRCSQFVEDVHRRLREGKLREQEQRRVQAVRDLLDGRPVEVGDLGYPLDQEHLALVVWGPRRRDALEGLGRETGDELLTIEAGGSTSWAWLGAAPHTLEPVRGASLAIGSPAEGLEGFRASHAQARLAERVGRRTGSPLTLYRDVALEALALGNEQEALAFVAGELGEMATDSARHTALRKTLMAYFACGQNASATASELDVSEKTVANRLKSVEERLGEPATARRAELELALRLRAVSEPSGTPKA
jgi:hypothetical protein